MVFKEICCYKTYWKANDFTQAGVWSKRAVTPLTSEAGNGFSSNLHFWRFAQKDLKRWHSQPSFWIHFLNLSGLKISLDVHPRAKPINHMSAGPGEDYLCSPRLNIWRTTKYSIECQASIFCMINCRINFISSIPVTAFVCVQIAKNIC